MNIFKTSLRVVVAHRLYILIYPVALSLFGLLTGTTQARSSSDQVKQATASVAVIDRDSSMTSHGVRGYVEPAGEARPLKDSRQATQDATAQNHINYILIIPAGYEQRLQEAIRQSTEPPRMDAVTGYEPTTGSLMNVHTDSYLGRVADYLSTLTEDLTQAVSLIRDTINHSAPAERVAQDTTPLPHGLIVYAKFSIYPVIAFTIVTISTLMASLGRQVTHSRLTATPVGSRSRNLGVIDACLVIGLIGWLWIFGLVVAVFGASAVTTSIPLLGVIETALGAYMLVAVSLGFLMDQFGLGRNVASTVASIGDMAPSLLVGTWVSIKWMPDAAVQAIRLTPGYWAIQAIPGAFAVTLMFTDVIGPLLTNCGTRILFTAAIFAVAMAVDCIRTRSSL